jgi:two-component system cell cycle response regulator DivK
MSDSAKRTILVVDDDPDFVGYLKTILEEAGHLVTTAFDGEEALTRVERSLPDLVTLDINMPRKSGVLFYRQVKSDSRLRSIPVIVITGMPLMNEYFTARFPAAPERVFDKLIAKDSLITAVNEILAERAT